MLVADLMQKDVKSIAPDASVRELVTTLADQRVSGLPVVGTSGRVMGVVSATDVLQASSEKDDAVAQARFLEHTMVKEIMTPNAHVIDPGADVLEAAKYMADLQARVQPVRRADGPRGCGHELGARLRKHRLRRTI